jgi:hypothetical protein
MSKLDKEFKNLADRINQKLEVAAKALQEANELAAGAELPGLIVSRWIREEADSDQELEDIEEKLSNIDTNALSEQMNIAGWSTSSSYC